MAVETTHPHLDAFIAARPDIPRDLATSYEEALDKVLRWQDGPLQSDEIETDKDHVDRSLQILRQIETGVPHLPSQVSFKTVSEIIYIHDAGEILVGDLARSHPDFEALKPSQKKREARAFRVLTQRYVKEDGLRDQARALYERYDDYDPADREATLAKLIDKLQALRFAKEHIYKKGQRTEGDKARDRSAGLLAEFGVNLMRNVSPVTRGELMVFLSEELKSYYGDDYDLDHVREARRKLVEALWE